MRIDTPSNSWRLAGKVECLTMILLSIVTSVALTLVVNALAR